MRVTSWLPAGVGGGVGHGLRPDVCTSVLGLKVRGAGVVGAVTVVTEMVGAGVCGSGVDCILA